MSTPYDPKAVEAKWQDRWEKQRAAEVDLRHAEGKYYMLMMFPYPSGDRLHVGHGRNYILGDALYRYLRMHGKRALNPMGWDAFGLPAENAAIQRRVHPRDWTFGNIKVMKQQFRRWGILYDWSKEIASCTPEYYRWNQWLFLRMLERGLAYRKHSPVNWCPSCQTVLANEQVVDGACERCGTPVVQRDLEQWFLRITDYADRLLAGLDELPGWPEKVKTMQRNWIGRSEGAEIDFAVPALGQRVTVFTTRPDTLHGATFLVLAPEHPLAPPLLAGHPRQAEIEAWIARVRNTPRIEREGRGARRRGATPARRRSTWPPASRSRSGSPTTCCRTTGPAPSWRCRRTTPATWSSRARKGCRYGWSTIRRNRPCRRAVRAVRAARAVTSPPPPPPSRIPPPR